MSIKTYSNKFILQTILVIALVLIIRLAISAADYDNWRGFFYSSLHVLTVAVFTYYAVRRRSDNTTIANKKPE